MFIEKWRVDELSMVLNRIALILQAGGQSEWAGVFRHYHEEADSLSRITPIEIDKLERLTMNLCACLEDGCSLRNPQLLHEDDRVGTSLLREYVMLRTRLFQILADLKNRLRETIH